MQMGFYFDQNRCTGCYTCVVACKDWNDIPAGPVSWRKCKTIEDGKFPKPFVAFLTLSCFHCENPPCVDICPTNAITKREDNGIVIADRDLCMGRHECGECLRECPYLIPQFGADRNAKMEKCDFCLDRWLQGKRPICVEACPTRALEAGPMDEIKKKFGKTQVTEGFKYFGEAKPAVVFRSKVRKKVN